MVVFVMRMCVYGGVSSAYMVDYSAYLYVYCSGVCGACAYMVMFVVLLCIHGYVRVYVRIW